MTLMHQRQQIQGRPDVSSPEGLDHKPWSVSSAALAAKSSLAKTDVQGESLLFLVDSAARWDSEAGDYIASDHELGGCHTGHVPKLVASLHPALEDCLVDREPRLLLDVQPLFLHMQIASAPLEALQELVLQAMCSHKKYVLK